MLSTWAKGSTRGGMLANGTILNQTKQIGTTAMELTAMSMNSKWIETEIWTYTSVLGIGDALVDLVAQFMTVTPVCVRQLWAVQATEVISRSLTRTMIATLFHILVMKGMVWNTRAIIWLQGLPQLPQKNLLECEISSLKNYPSTWTTSQMTQISTRQSRDLLANATTAWDWSPWRLRRSNSLLAMVQILPMIKVLCKGSKVLIHTDLPQVLPWLRTEIL